MLSARGVPTTEGLLIDRDLVKLIDEDGSYLAFALSAQKPKLKGIGERYGIGWE